MRYLFYRLPVLATALTLLCPIGTIGIGQAEDTAPQRLKEVVVTATRTPVPVEQSASAVTIIDAEAIEAKQAKTVLEVLRDVPGLDVRQLGGLGGQTSVFMRGGNSSHTLVMIDGVQVNSPTTGAFDFSDLTIDNVERIEVIRGPQSTLYGSDAIGGVIHVMTKRGSGTASGFLSSEFGAFDTFHERAGVSGGTDRVDYALSISRLDSGGISRASGDRGNAEEDPYDNTTVSARLGVNVLGDGRVDFTGRYTHSNTATDSAFLFTDAGQLLPTDDPDSAQQRDTIVAALAVSKPVATWWDQRLQLSLNDDDLDASDPDPATEFSPAADNDFRIDIQGRRLDWQHDFTITDGVTVTAGYELEDQVGTNAGSFRETIFNQAGYGQVQLNPVDALFFVVGGRFDSNNRFGDQGTYKASGTYRVEHTGTTIRSSHGTGFRGPSLNDLFFPAGTFGEITFSGNPDVKAETSAGADAGIEQELLAGRLSIGATYFYNSFDDLIASTLDLDAMISRPENIKRARSQGVEVVMQAELMEGLDVGAHYTRTASRDLDTAHRLARRPVDKGSVNVGYSPFAALRLNADIFLVGDSFSDNANRNNVEGYSVVNVAGRYDITKTAQVFVRIDNLLNYDYEEVLGFGTFGRAVFGGLKLSF